MERQLSSFIDSYNGWKSKEAWKLYQLFGEGGNRSEKAYPKWVLIISNNSGNIFCCILSTFIMYYLNLLPVTLTAKYLNILKWIKKLFKIVSEDTKNSFPENFWEFAGKCPLNNGIYGRYRRATIDDCFCGLHLISQVHLVQYYIVGKGIHTPLSSF